MPFTCTLVFQNSSMECNAKSLGAKCYVYTVKSQLKVSRQYVAKLTMQTYKYATHTYWANLYLYLIILNVFINALHLLVRLPSWIKYFTDLVAMHSGIAYFTMNLCKAAFESESL